MNDRFEQAPNLRRLHELGGAKAVLAVVVDRRWSISVREDALDLLVQHVDSDLGGMIRQEVDRLILEEDDKSLLKTLHQIRIEMDFFSGKCSDIQFLIDVATAQQTEIVRRCFATELLETQIEGQRKKDILRALSLSRQLRAEWGADLSGLSNPGLFKEIKRNQAERN